jgi:hypothetical protein
MQISLNMEWWRADMTIEQKDEVFAAMRKWEYNTCIRFVPWVAQQSIIDYGLPDEGHITFKKASE